jgi:hypothetical protein
MRSMLICDDDFLLPLYPHLTLMPLELIYIMHFKIGTRKKKEKNN